LSLWLLAFWAEHANDPPCFIDVLSCGVVGAKTLAPPNKGLPVKTTSLQPIKLTTFASRNTGEVALPDSIVGPRLAASIGAGLRPESAEEVAEVVAAYVAGRRVQYSDLLRSPVPHFSMPG
jgi:hypothetical protein